MIYDSIEVDTTGWDLAGAAERLAPFMAQKVSTTCPVTADVAVPIEGARTRATCPGQPNGIELRDAEVRRSQAVMSMVPGEVMATKKPKFETITLTHVAEYKANAPGSDWLLIGAYDNERRAETNAREWRKDSMARVAVYFKGSPPDEIERAADAVRVRAFIEPVRARIVIS